jgi:type IV pilus assembly protein PilB
VADIDLERAVAVLVFAHRLLTPTEAVEVIRAGRDGHDLADRLVARVGETALLAAVAQELRQGFVDLTAPDTPWRPDDALAARLGVGTLRANHALPVRHTSGQLGVALYNPAAQSDVVSWIRAQAGVEVVPLLAPKFQIDGRLVYMDTAGFADADPGEEPARDASASAPVAATSNPVVEFLDNLLARAVSEGASDVHFLCQADGSLLIRFRVDGQMRRQAVPLRRREAEIIGTLLAKCGDSIDASDRTRPQDGTFHFTAPSGRRIDARLGMLPQSHGPTVVVRLLDPSNINRRLEDMGFATATLEQMRRVVRAPQGSVLFMGPTGSGKTTTLYALLKELPAMDMSIMTAEDPVEYRLPAIGQTQIRTGLGEKSLTFAKALRSILRLDPDVILVGEIRDEETAETAMHAALTGHMVLSTLHAKTAVGAYARLDELAIEPWLAAESLSLAVNQRLVRVVHECATFAPPTDAERTVLARYNLPDLDRVAHPRPGGCGGCNRTGFRGRVAVVEVMEPSEETKSLVAIRAPQADIVAAATASGYTAILDDAFRHVKAGRVPVMELLRVAGAGAI